MLLIFVRRSEGELFRYLRSMLAEYPVFIAWDRRVGQRRGSVRRVPGGCRRRERRASRLSLETLPFVAVAPKKRAGEPR